MGANVVRKPADAPTPARPVGRGTAIATQTIGEAWLEIAGLILATGRPSNWEGLPLQEVELITLEIAEPSPNDALISRYASPERLAWMRSNFTERTRVAALGGARSYASRIFDYAGAGRDQIEWVIDKLTRDPVTTNVTITTFEPLTDTTYIPCVSLIDFWLRSGRLEVIAYAHSIDFGKKGFGNLVQLADLQHIVAGRLGVPKGALVMIIKSAHIYDTELKEMTEIVATAASAD